MNIQDLESFLQHLRLERGCSRATLAAYEADVRQYFAAGVPPAEYVAHLKALGLARRSIHRKLSALSCFTGFLVATGRAAANPFGEMKIARYASPPPRALSQPQIQKLFSNAPKPNDPDFVPYLLLRVLYACGLRASELTGLGLSHLDLEKGLLRVLGKGGKARVVPVDATTLGLVREYLAIRPSGAECGALFLTPKKNAYTRQGVWKALKRASAKQGLGSDVSPHTLRHAFATHCLENGMNLRSLQMLLGHSDISTTQIYTAVSDRRLRESLEKFHPRSKKSG